jgi:hypothetical protein
VTETNSNEFEDTCKPSDRVSELLESHENISTDKPYVRTAVTSEMREMLQEETAGFTVGTEGKYCS